MGRAMPRAIEAESHDRHEGGLGGAFRDVFNQDRRELAGQKARAAAIRGRASLHGESSPKIVGTSSETVGWIATTRV
jgi:hypothetical protein